MLETAVDMEVASEEEQEEIGIRADVEVNDPELGRSAVVSVVDDNVDVF